MGLIENKLRWCIKKAEKEGVKHRGLKKVEPDIEKANSHISKAQHNLKVMIYLIEGNFLDWAVSASFYSMYHCLLAILAKFGYESRNQECTLTAVEHLINNKMIEIDINWLKKIAAFDIEQKEEKDILTLREDFQYGTITVLENSKVKQLENDTMEFIEIVREALKKEIVSE